MVPPIHIENLLLIHKYNNTKIPIPHYILLVSKEI